MTEIVLDIRKGIDANAAEYFEKAKKARKKIKGADETIKRCRDELERLQKQIIEIEKPEIEAKVAVPKRWFHRFRWFKTSDNFLVIGGRDATTNEIVIKKYAEPKDMVLHTDMAGSPFFVIKSDGREITETAIRETADATCTFSRAWKLGIRSQDVFYVRPEQLTKSPKAGEYLQKGAFMIVGKTSYIENKINLAVGMSKEGIMTGPIEAVKVHCENFVVIEPGREKTSMIAKEVQKRIGGDLDSIIRSLPGGGCKTLKR